jgi:hypothetical protein
MFASAATNVQDLTIKVKARFPTVDQLHAVPISEDAHAVDLTPIDESICQ